MTGTQICSRRNICLFGGLSVAGSDRFINNVSGLNGKYKIRHYRIDKSTGNAYSKWIDMGKPAQPTVIQHEVIKQAGNLALYYPEETVEINRNYNLDIIMQQNSVSLIEFEKIN